MYFILNKIFSNIYILFLKKLCKRLKKIFAKRSFKIINYLIKILNIYKIAFWYFLPGSQLVGSFVNLTDALHIR